MAEVKSGDGCSLERQVGLKGWGLGCWTEKGPVTQGQESCSG